MSDVVAKKVKSDASISGLLIRLEARISRNLVEYGAANSQIYRLKKDLHAALLGLLPSATMGTNHGGFCVIPNLSRGGDNHVHSLPYSIALICLRYLSQQLLPLPLCYFKSVKHLSSESKTSKAPH